MNGISLPFPKNRVACFFCAKPLMKGMKFVGIQICTSRGIAIITCQPHAQLGDMMISQANQWVASKQKEIIDQQTKAE